MIALDWIIRGATIGVCLLLATQLLFKIHRGSARLAALFILGVACYVLVSAPEANILPKTIIRATHVVSIFNVVFFWLFATSLFKDEWRWEHYLGLPPLLLLLTLPFRAWHSAAEQSPWISCLHQSLVIALLIHVVFLAIRDFNEDLVQSRRHFRLTVATVIPMIVIIIVGVESGLFGVEINQQTLLFQAIALFLLVAGFSYWILLPRADLLASNRQVSQSVSDREIKLIGAEATEKTGAIENHLHSIHRLEADRLNGLMLAGAYRQPGLTVSELAAQMKIPEHQVRKLINERLGYRNFTAYLNDYRIADVKSKLADPANSQTQIAQIAYEAGFNSIGPFNRAFRQITQLTPSEYRRKALADSEKS